MNHLVTIAGAHVPVLVAAAGDRFLELITAQIGNPNTCRAYAK